MHACGSCVPSRSARENCVRCACTAATLLTEGRQRTLASRGPQPAGLRGPHRAAASLLRPAAQRHGANSDSNTQRYGRNRRSTDLRYHAAHRTSAQPPASCAISTHYTAIATNATSKIRLATHLYGICEVVYYTNKLQLKVNCI